MKKNEIMFHKVVNGENLDSAGYLDYLKNTSKKLKQGFGNGYGTRKDLDVFGREIIAEAVQDMDNVKFSGADDDIIRAEKEKLKNLINSIKEQCGIVNEGTDSIVSKYKLKKREAIGVAPVESMIVGEKLTAEVKEPSYAEIEDQVRAIRNMIEGYRDLDINIALRDTIESFNETQDLRLKELRKNDIKIMVKHIFSGIDADVLKLGDSPYLEVEAAKADLVALKSEIEKSVEYIFSDDIIEDIEEVAS